MGCVVMGPVYGRDSELSLAQAALSAARSGEGQLVLWTGDAGIGKTALLEQVASEAGREHMRVAWGRCWEAGGAPAFWPWSEVFRALERADAFADREHAMLDPVDVRFRRFEAARDELVRVTRDTPLVIILDDLHMSDLPSLLFLQLCARSMKDERIALIGAYREVEARLHPEIGECLARIGRDGQVTTLQRLSTSHVAMWVEREAPGLPAALATKIEARAEGNPLFVRELLAVAKQDASSELPSGLRGVLDERLRRASDDVVEMLRSAAVLGRRVVVDDLASILARPVAELERSLEAACAAGILAPERGHYRFTHILLRDALYAQLPASTRRQLHRQVGEYLERKGIDSSTVAHHLLEGCDHATAQRAAEVARDAAAMATGKLAFETAAALAARGLEALNDHGLAARHRALACELEIALAEAEVRSGGTAAGRDRSIRAAAMARELGEAVLEARAALAYGAQVASGRVDPTMVTLLRGALDSLGRAESDQLRALVMARLAAAVLPTSVSSEHHEACGLALDAVALARKVGDRETLLFASYYATHSVAYTLSYAERFELIRSVIELGTELARDSTLINAAPWWIANLCERGAHDAVRDALDRYAARVEASGTSHYRCRLLLARASVALLAGDFDGAAELGAEARKSAADARSVVGLVGWAHHRIALAQARGEPASVAADADHILAAVSPLDACEGAVAWTLAATGRVDEARAVVERSLARVTPDSAQQQDWLLAADAAVMLRDETLARGLWPVVEEASRQIVMFWGMPHGTAAIGPSARILGDLATVLGRPHDARRLYLDAIARCERMAAVPLLALARARLATVDVAASLRSASARSLELVREGDVWLVTSFTGLAVRLRHAKGVEYLERLVSNPDQPFHVTELFAVAGSLRDGDILDTRARDSYQRRVNELHAEIADAEESADIGRAERARSELDAIIAELMATTSRSGRDRGLGSLTQRARINVQRRLRVTIDQIGRRDPELGRYLGAAIRTGLYCSYRPV